VYVWQSLKTIQIFLRSGYLAIYEIHPTRYPADVDLSGRSMVLLAKFVKATSRFFDIQQVEDTGKTIVAEVKRAQRALVPFATSPAPDTTLSGVFFTGDRPCWVVATDKGGLQIHPSSHAIVHAFTPCSLWESKGDFLMYTEEVRSPFVSCPRSNYSG
jgi:cleavage and polyadenylation specificity factor subunit 1